jgi:hypothetical protein
MAENAGHSFILIGGKVNPSRTEISCMIVDFLDEH